MKPAALAFLLLLTACGESSGVLVPPGTWGGDDAGVVVESQRAHVHIGCTKGDTDEPLRLDTSGRFDARGSYNLDAFPVDRGLVHPARFFGSVSGDTMTLEIRVMDTGQKLGPVILRFGLEPTMRRCPICR